MDLPKKGRPPKAPKIDRVCQQCGEKYQVYAWENRGHKYCSRECYNAWKIGKGIPRLTPQPRKCLYCGSEFLIGGKGNKAKWEKYCDRSCSAKHRYLHLPGHERPREMKPTDAAWFAGLFDGEGSIVWPRKTEINTVRLSVKMTSKPALDAVQRIVGTGKVREVTKYNRNPRHSQSWSWDCYGENARVVLRQIYKRLIVKREAAEVALGIRHATKPPLTQRTKQILLAERGDVAA